ncbi:helix-turn-helix domain-containing protein [Streptomyces sp. YS-3]|uniref:helix-turn-helix domain-containing protein n=1 Tax=Streptomyces sp. YS-3 TaxID=3381352 RepID=UPI003862B7E2
MFPTALSAAEGVQGAVMDLLEGEHAHADLESLLTLARRVGLELECYAAAAVMDARARGASWKEVGASSFTSATTASARWSPAEVRRLFERRAAARSAGRTAHAVLMPAARASADESALDEAALARARASSSLSCALSFLLRRSGLSMQEAAQGTGLSRSYVSKIVSGDRVPTWPAAQALAEAVGANAGDMRPLWEAAQGLARAPRPSLDEAVARLGSALRGMYLAAGCPPYEQVSRLSGEVVPPAVVEGALRGEVVPCWETTSALLTALNAQPQDLRGIWDDANYAFLLCLQMPLHDGAPPQSGGECAD